MSDQEHHHHLELQPDRAWKCTLCGEEMPLGDESERGQYSKGGILPARQMVKLWVRTNEHGQTECRLEGERWMPVFTCEQIKRFMEGQA